MAKELDIRELMAIVDLVKDEGKYAEKMKALQDAEKRLAERTKLVNSLEEVEATKDALSKQKAQLELDKTAFEKYMEEKETKAKDSLKQRESELEQRYQTLKAEFEGNRDLKRSVDESQKLVAEKEVALSNWAQSLSKQEAAVRMKENKVRQAIAAMSKYWEEANG